jgi:hypothetical protein
VKPFEDLVLEWLNEYGARIPPNEQGGMQAMVRLMELLKSEGYTNDDVKRKSNIIVGHCVRDTSKRYMAWRCATETRLGRARVKVFTERTEVDTQNTPTADPIPDTTNDTPSETYTESKLVGRLLDPAILNREPTEVKFDLEFSRLLGFKDE